MRFVLSVCFFLFFFINGLYCFGYNVSIRISINGQDYVEDIIKDFSSIKNKIQFLTLKLLDTTFSLDDIEDNFYQINILNDIEVLNKKIRIYKLNPLFGDRFPHIIWVYNKNILRKEVYDLNNKLLYAYGFDNIIMNNTNITRLKNPINTNGIPISYYKGFVAIYKKKLDKFSQILYSDGLNKFSIFTKRDGKKFPESEEIAFGNYIYKCSKNNRNYIIIGTIPYNEMKKFLHLYIKGVNYKH